MPRRAAVGDTFAAQITLLTDVVSPPTQPPEVTPPPEGAHPEHPIFFPPEVQHPIVIPPDAIGPGVPPDTIVWPKPPGTDPPPHVAHPIVPTPEHPIYIPKPEPPPIAGLPHPEHPIYIPFPPPDGGEKPPPDLGDFYPAHPIVLPPPKGVAIILNPDNVPVTPPEGVPPNYQPVLLWFGPGTVAIIVWIPPVPMPKR